MQNQHQYTDATPIGISSFVIGVVSITTGNFLAAIVGLIMGLVARNRPNNQRSLTLWGIWLNIIALAFWVIAFLVIIFFVVVTVGAGFGVIANASY